MTTVSALRTQKILDPIRAMPRRLYRSIVLVPTILVLLIFRDIGSAIGIFLLAGFIGGCAYLVIAEFRLKYLRSKFDIGQVGTKALLHFIGEDVSFVDSGAVQDGMSMSASGIAYHNKTIYLLEKGIVAVIPLSLVRRFRMQIEGYERTEIMGGSASAGTMNAHLKANIANKTARSDARNASGIFLDVADVDNPIWQYCTTNPKICKRWHEILTQAREGKI